MKQNYSSKNRLREAVFCTVLTRSYVRHAVALRNALTAAGNTEALHVLVNDADAATLPEAIRGIQFHGLDEFEGEFPDLMPYYFDAFELCCAMRPFLVDKLLRKYAGKVIYFDTDIFPVGNLGPVWSKLEECPVVLTPHQLRPPALDLLFINEVEIVDQGILNAGFSAWKRSPEALEALAWMKERFPLYVFNRRSKGMTGDQTLMPFLPIYFPGTVHVWRCEGANIAFWNANERKVEAADGRYTINGQPVLFFHVSGYRTAQPGVPCTYLGEAANRQILEVAPWLKKVMEDFHRVLAVTEGSSLPVEYKFAKYKNIALNPALRTMLFRNRDLSLLDTAVLRELLIERMRLAKRWILRLARTASATSEPSRHAAAI
jgi:hypothetical protein